jgi:hypothetical protein
MIEPPDDTRLVVINEHGDTWAVIRDDHAAYTNYEYTSKSQGIPPNRWWHGVDEDNEDYPVTFEYLQTLGTLHYIGEKL